MFYYLYEVRKLIARDFFFNVKMLLPYAVTVSRVDCTVVLLLNRCSP